MNTTDIKERVAELSAALVPIEQTDFEMLNEEMWGEAEDYCSYNASFYCGGWIKPIFDASFKGAVLQTVGEYQVIRIIAVRTYMEGLAYDEVPEDWEEEGAPDFPELELKGCEEVRQVWISPDKEVYAVDLQEDNCLSMESYLVHIDGMQDYCYEPFFANTIIEEVNELTDYGYGYNEDISLAWRLSEARQYLQIAEPAFLALIEGHDLWRKAKGYKHVFKVAHRRGWAFPTDVQTARLWLDHIGVLDNNGEDTHNPLLICPAHAQLTELHQQANERQNARNAERERLYEQRKAEEQRKQREEDEKDFNRHHAYLFGYDFTDTTFRYTSLDSVEAYIVEGEIMHHCIGYNRYYRDHNQLSMHIADLEGNRVATCTIDIKKGEVVCIQPIANDIGYRKTYGIEWKATEDYKRILTTLSARMHILQKQAEENKRRTRRELKIAV